MYQEYFRVTVFRFENVLLYSPKNLVIEINQERDRKNACEDESTPILVISVMTRLVMTEIRIFLHTGYNQDVF